MQGKGRTKHCYSVDRINPDLGYIPGNIQKLEVGENSRKGNKKLEYDWQTGTAIVTTHYNEQPKSSDPF